MKNACAVQSQLYMTQAVFNAQNNAQHRKNRKESFIYKSTRKAEMPKITPYLTQKKVERSFEILSSATDK